MIAAMLLSSCSTTLDHEHGVCGSENSILGPHLVPDRILGADFGPACVTHDGCYDTLGQTKQECDHQFKLDVREAARQTGPLARFPARVAGDLYHFGVKIGGKNAYEEAQRLAREKDEADKS